MVKFHPDVLEANVTDFIGYNEHLANITDGLFFPIILLVIFIVSFVVVKAQFSASRAFTYASFFGALLSVPLAILGLMSNNYMYLLIVATGVGILWMRAETNPGSAL